MTQVTFEQKQAARDARREILRKTLVALADHPAEAEFSAAVLDEALDFIDAIHLLANYPVQAVRQGGPR